MRAVAAGKLSIVGLYPDSDINMPRNMLIVSGDFKRFFRCVKMLLFSVEFTLQLTMLKKTVSTVKIKNEFPTSKIASLYKFAAPKYAIKSGKPIGPVKKVVNKEG
ncbi:MAG: hypothetical protein HGA49_12140 [Eubacteriaceae bacterium]|nr:hypothetical protein [Eubacteriaceae bacterium]